MTTMPPTDPHRLHLRPGATAHPGSPYPLTAGPAQGLRHTALHILELASGDTHAFATGGAEWIVLPLSGGGTVRVRPDGGQQGDEEREFTLDGRPDVFAGPTDFAYVPRDARVEITSGAAGRFALAGARCGRRLPARRGPAPEVPVEERGSGTCARQVRNFAAAHTFACDRLIAVEVVTPPGHWSSYPPHKHDEHRPGEESELEEIYWFALDGPTPAFHRVAPSRPGGADLLAEVRDGEAVLVPDGWHGPSVAPPGHPLYYLNVMAGPGPGRDWHITFHPDHAEGYR